jgi:hypothetical protein
VTSASLVFAILLSQNAVNPDAAIVAQFETRVDDYLKSTSKLRSDLPALKPTDSRDKLTQRETDLGRLIQEARPHAAQGDFFAAGIAVEFRRLIGIALQGRREHRIVKSLEHAEPVRGQLKVNAAYPPVPLQSMPPSLLANLPQLPATLDYRIVGHALVLRDVQANLVLDFLPKALP